MVVSWSFACFGTGVVFCELYYHQTSAMDVFSPPPKVGCATATPVAWPLSIMDWQRFLTDEGYYHGPIDGILGQLTQDAWNEWYADQTGIKFYEAK